MVTITVPAFAKINLDLRVLHKRSDGYHELRTIFQTISLKDTLTISYQKAKQTAIELTSDLDIPDNIVLRAVKMVVEQLRISGHIRLRLSKRIPMGAGLGGGSSNAAAALIALTALAGKRTTVAALSEMAAQLGSDVPFFLRGGTALGLGRGEELYPLPEPPAVPILVVASGVHVSTAAAYGALNRTLTQDEHSPILREFQTVAWGLRRGRVTGLNLNNNLQLKNDFEQSVFEQYPDLQALKKKLERFGARPAMMTGSGSALFGLFPGLAAARAAAEKFPPGVASVGRLVSRSRYESAWRRALGSAAENSIFAPASC